MNIERGGEIEKLKFEFLISEKIEIKKRLPKTMSYLPVRKSPKSYG